MCDCMALGHFRDIILLIDVLSRQSLPRLHIGPAEWHGLIYKNMCSNCNLYAIDTIFFQPKMLL